MPKKNARSTKHRSAEHCSAPGSVAVPAASAEHELLAVILFRIGRWAAAKTNPLLSNPEWSRLDKAGADGWLAVAKYIFENYELKLNASWKSVSVEMPDSEVSVLVCAPEDSEPVWIGYHDGEDWRTPDALKMECEVTHWMHLPEPPKGGPS